MVYTLWYEELCKHFMKPVLVILKYDLVNAQQILVVTCNYFCIILILK